MLRRRRDSEHRERADCTAREGRDDGIGRLVDHRTVLQSAGIRRIDSISRSLDMVSAPLKKICASAPHGREGCPFAY